MTAALVFLAGCGAQDVREVEPDHAPDLSLLEDVGNADYIPAESPDELIETAEPDVVVSGSLETLEQGRVIYTSPDDEDPQQQFRDAGTSR